MTGGLINGGLEFISKILQYLNICQPPCISYKYCKHNNFYQTPSTYGTQNIQLIFLQSTVLPLVCFHACGYYSHAPTWHLCQGSFHGNRGIWMSTGFQRWNKGHKMSVLGDVSPILAPAVHMWNAKSHDSWIPKSFDVWFDFLMWVHLHVLL